MIDEKKLLKALQGFYEREEEYKSVFDEQGIYYESQTGLIDEIIKYVQKMPKVGNWIPCSERLPKNDGEFIVMVRGKAKPRALYFDVEDKDWHCNEYCDYDVVAWMSMPEPWGGEI